MLGVVVGLFANSAGGFNVLFGVSGCLISSCLERAAGLERALLLVVHCARESASNGF